MQLAGFTKREPVTGDRLPAKEAADKPLVVLVREHRTGIKTKYNNDPARPGYKPEGGEGVQLDVADLTTDSVFIDVLWMNGAVVDNLAPYVGQALPVKLVWTASAKGGNAYLTVEGLDGAELAKAQAWAVANPNRFDTERAQRQANAQSFTQPAVTAQPGPIAAMPQQFATNGAQLATVPPAQAKPAPAPNNHGAVDVTDPAVQALLHQIASGQPAA